MNIVRIDCRTELLYKAEQNMRTILLEFNSCYGLTAGAERSIALNFNIDQEMAPRARLELATLRLTAGCSTIELPRND